MFNLTHRKNLTVVTSPMPYLETCALGIFIKWGARFEPVTLKGVAHFIEHMLFKGTKKYSYRKIKQQIEGRGGSVNAFTSQEVTAYYAQFLRKNLEITADILFDMVEHPLFEVKEIEKERNVILEEIKMYRDLPHARALSLLDELLWDKHPLGRDVIGYDTTVKYIRRNHLAECRDRYYVSPRIMIFCAGAFDRDVFFSTLASRLAGTKKGSPLKPQKPPAPLRGRKIVVEQKNIDQTHLCVGFRSIPYTHRYRFAIELLHVLMGANMSSRLFEEIREKRGLCYDVSTEVKKYKDSGAFIVHCGLDKKNIGEALACIIHQLEKIKDQLVSQRELERAKDYLLGQMAMNLERPMGRMFYLADLLISIDKIYSFEQLREYIRKVTPQDIRILARQLFVKERVCLTCVGNIEKNQADMCVKILEKGGV
ncbi:MAG: insulinase family protein [Candidatus Omnitrophica bacterium]|nr:insulinase family protein [Candidatus Omnitrophota bacterium]